MTRIRHAALLACAAALAGCGDDAVQSLPTLALPTARIKFFNFGVNAPGVNFYANDVKMTAISSATGTESTVGTTYSQVGAGGFYSAITPGQYTISGRIAAATDKDLAIAAVPVTIADGKSYSFYLSGIYDAATKKAEGFAVEDAYPANIDFTTAYVRLVNAISNSQPMTLYVKSTTTGTETAIGGPVAYKAAGAFVSIPGGVYDLATRRAGVTGDYIARTAVSFSPGRVYTVSARGDITVTSTTATNRPFLDNTTNR